MNEQADRTPMAQGAQFARGEEQVVVVYPDSRVTLDELVREAVETVAPSAQGKGLAIETYVEPGVAVRADRDRLQQVLWNLLTNAIKFTPAPGAIVVRAHKGSGCVTISVRDSGIGISQENLPLVFQRFWQAHSGASREFGGLGIGLALARHLVEMHGGTITAASEGHGRGSLFTVSLPTSASASARDCQLRPIPG
jgi:signal transduction histidine kinase